jgi:hypothetical protein
MRGEGFHAMIQKEKNGVVFLMLPASPATLKL